MDKYKDYLFVYGTLKSDATNIHAKSFHQQANYIGEAKRQGCLYLVSYYPGAVPSFDKENFVYGELWQLNTPCSTLEVLDLYEECSELNPLPHEYKRSFESVWLGQTLLNAWVYIYQKDTSSLNRIISGVFNHH